MHRALLLHEIIAGILQAERSTPGFLHTCLFINKIFSLEAARLLWNRCGTHYGYATAGYISPMIRHLGQIVLEDPIRAQLYADFIHILGFADEGESNDFIDEAKWHPQLACLQFPNLEDVGLYRSTNSTAMNTGNVVIHYAQPRLKAFRLWDGSQLSDSFLDTLCRSCPTLRSLDLRGISQNNVSRDGLIHFLETTASLVEFKIRTGLDDSWSYRAFDILTRHSNLKSLSIPDIQDDWTQTLRDASPINPAFPKLKEFRGGATDLCLQDLARYLPNLESLELYLQNLPPSRHILASSSNFTRLTKLVVHFGAEDSVVGHDLIHFTQNTPELVEVSIGEYDSCRPLVYGITDNVIDQVAHNLPNISQLSLRFSQPDMLTWQSILSFARHCKKLEVLKLSCNFSWQDAINGGVDTTFDSLWWLEVVLGVNNRDEQIANDPATVQAIVERFAALAPRLSSLDIEGGNTADDTLKWAIYDMCMDRS